ncbi:MAG: hypothetical protein FWD78_12905 [Treponema sp.]|nr:hypothetical protein [Treponema sp.]
MTITSSQTVKIPANRQITLEAPLQIPAGTTACFEIMWFPLNKAVNNLDATLLQIQELCRDSSLTVDNFLDMRRQDNKFEEMKIRKLFAGDAN